MPESTIRRARAEDTTALTAVAHAAKKALGYPARWIRSWAEELTVTREYVAAHPVYLAERETEIAGFYALREMESRWRAEHFWVLPVSMGLGIGRLLFRHAVETARAGGCAELLIDSDPNAAGCYERMVLVGTALSVRRWTDATASGRNS